VTDGHLVAAAQPQKVFVTSLCLAWSPDGKRIAVGGIQPGNRSGICCYEVSNKLNQQIYQTDQHGDLTMVAWSPDGRYLAGVGDTLHAAVQLFVWETGSGRLIFSTPANSWSSLAWSPDSQRLALAHERVVEIWEPSRGLKVLEYQEHPTLVWSLAWSPRGDLIASASEVDGFVHVWESSTGRLHSLYQGDTYSITDMAWSPDGAYLATCHKYGGSVCVWQP
jgi:WD40 repeat protein